MIKGIGVDIIDVDRIQELVKKNRRFVDKIFSDAEIQYCESKRNCPQHYAARFTAKEAFFKALGTGWIDGMSWKDVSVENDSLGKPKIVLNGRALERFRERNLSKIHLSISHSKKIAMAFVIVE